MSAVTSPFARLPPELWPNIVGSLSIVDKATRSDADTWADVTNCGENALHLALDTFARQYIAENLRTLFSVSCVSRLFRRLSLPILFEMIVITSPESLLRLCQNVKELPRFAAQMRQSTRRVDVIFEVPQPYYDEETDLSGADWREDIHLVFSACPKLTYLVWMPYDHTNDDIRLFDILPVICPAIQILYWKTHDVVDAYYLFHYRNLRVFHFEMPELRSLTAARLELSHLHTFSTHRPYVIFNAQFPCLRTLSIFGDSDDRDAWEDFVYADADMRISSLFNRGTNRNDAVFKYAHLRVTDLAIQPEDLPEFLHLSWPHLEHLGILNQSDEDDVVVVLSILDCIERDADDGRFDKLQSIRLMDDTFVEGIFEDLQELSRRFSQKQIDLLDHQGRLISPCA